MNFGGFNQSHHLFYWPIFNYQSCWNQIPFQLQNPMQLNMNYMENLHIYQPPNQRVLPEHFPQIEQNNQNQVQHEPNQPEKQKIQRHLEIERVNKNLKSNTLKYFLLYLKGPFLYSGKLKKLKQFKGLHIEESQFNQLIQNHIRPKKHYFKLSVIEQVLKNENCHPIFSKILRIALKIFLVHELPIFLKKSPRLKPDTQRAYLKERKKLYYRLILSCTQNN